MKRKFIVSIFLFVAIIMVVFSCQKGEEADNIYYGSFYASNSKLSNCSLMVKFNGDSLGILRPEGCIGKSTNGGRFQYKDGTTGKLAFYKGDTLVCDTVISIKANAVKDSIEVIYSDKYKKYGFWDSNSLTDYFKVSQDSMKWELLYEDKTTAQQLSDIEVTFGYYLINYVFVKRNSINVAQLKSGSTTSYTQSFGFKDNKGNTLTGLSNVVAIKIKNSNTKKYITDSNGYADFSAYIPNNDNGKYLECVLKIIDGKKAGTYEVTIDKKELN